MKQIVAVAILVTALVVASAGGARNVRDNPYELARPWDTPLGPVYGPVLAGPRGSSSYGFVSR